MTGQFVMGNITVIYLGFGAWGGGGSWSASKFIFLACIAHECRNFRRSSTSFITPLAFEINSDCNLTLSIIKSVQYQVKGSNHA